MQQQFKGVAHLQIFCLNIYKMNMLLNPKRLHLLAHCHISSFETAGCCLFILCVSQSVSRGH